MEVLKRILLVLLVGLAMPRQAVAAEAEYQLKAAFLVEFAKYIDWPASTFPSSSAPIVIGVFGSDPFGPLLNQAASGQRIDGREIAVRRVRNAQEAKDCHILFVPKDQTSKVQSGLQGLKSGVLLVGESPNFAANGGMINFYMEQRRIRFEINPTAARNAGLSISSRLLSLARIVKGDA